MADEMTARQLLVKLTKTPADQIIPVLGTSLDVLRDDELEGAATTLIEHKILEGILTSDIPGSAFEYHDFVVPFGKLADKLNENPTWDIVHLHVDRRGATDEIYAHVLVMRPVEKADGDAE